MPSTKVSRPADARGCAAQAAGPDQAATVRGIRPGHALPQERQPGHLRATITPSTPTALTAIITQAGITDLAAYLQGHARARVCDATLGVACQTRDLRLGRPGNRPTSSGPGFP